MKKKELMKRLSAIAMAAMMTVTMIPSNAFAADIDFSDGGQETIEVQTDEEEDAEISIEDEADESAETLTGEDLSEEETDEVDVFSDDGEEPVATTILHCLRMKRLTAIQKMQKQQQKNILRLLILMEQIKLLQQVEMEL